MSLRLYLLAAPGLVAAGTLAMGQPPASTTWLIVQTCHGRAISIPIEKSPKNDDRRCPGACHAVCDRGRADEEED